MGMPRLGLESSQLQIEPGLQNFRLSESRDGNRYGLLGIEAEADWCDVVPDLPVPDAALDVVDPLALAGTGRQFGRIAIRRWGAVFRWQD